MNKTLAVVGVAAVATFVGCKDEDYKYAHGSANQPKLVSPVKADSPSPAPVVVAERPSCKCPPGARHTKPCLCGAPDCTCAVVPPPPPPPPPPAPAYTVYTVKNGDYLAKISKKYNVTISSIKRLNNLKGDSIRIGQKLKLPGKIDLGAEPAAPAAATSAAAKPVVSSSAAYKGETREYVVKSGDTLGAIAYGNGCNIRQLKAINGLSGDTLRVGQKLKVPANAKAVAKPAPPKKESAAKPTATSAAPASGTTSETATPATGDSAEQAKASEASVPAITEPAADPQYATYEVQDGEDMTAICIRFNASAAVIRELNNLPEGAQLTKGQIIKLPPEAQQ